MYTLNSTTDLAFQGCLRLLQLNELSPEFGDTVLSSLHTGGGVAVLGNDPQDALDALHAVGSLLGGGLQAGKQLLGGLPGVPSCLSIPAQCPHVASHNTSEALCLHYSSVLQTSPRSIYTTTEYLQSFDGSTEQHNQAAVTAAEWQPVAH